MYRKIYKDLIKWKNNQFRKPLILQGARQVGKTYIVNIFGEKEYENVAYFNFEKDEELKNIFADLNPRKIVERLEYLRRTKIAEGSTLIIFDEIQACPRALTSLKYFNEEANGFHIIALGSLLGVAVNREQFSFPVGKVEFKTMYAMDFEEFLMALGEDLLIKEIRESYSENRAMIFHERAIELYRQFLVVGGMPEIVLSFVQNRNLVLVREKQIDIINSYFDDMSKYNTATEISKTRLLYRNMCIQLTKENKKFMYKTVRESGRASEFENAIEWLCLSGVAGRLFRLTQVKLPFDAYASLSDFKFYVNDVGLCCALLKVLPSDVLNENEMLNDFKGGLAENYVYNQLLINNISAFYWVSGNNNAEIDFIVRIGGEIVPIEVKSSEHTRSRSLAEFGKQFNPNLSIRISLKNFGFENGIKSIPLYAVFCLDNGELGG